MQTANDRAVVRLPLLDQYIAEQGRLTAVERFAQLHEAGEAGVRRYRDLLPSQRPTAGKQYGFEVDLDQCTGCKACVTACHRLNGLDQAEGETWRSVGSLQGRGSGAALQPVTTACHHCVDPACLQGCPVNAYEKDPTTGIVRHLDDQCIGCQYCTLTCPYEVPQFNRRLGIVRKCDMCADRLEAGEAPACVDACPNEAIAIRLVDQAELREAARGPSALPGAPSPALTVPATRYISAKPIAEMMAADHHHAREGAEHTPLVVMLVLTQASVGAFAVEFLLRHAPAWAWPAQSRALHMVTAVAVGLLALLASTLHLGRPLQALRALIGLRRSWLSREILLFALFAVSSIVYAALSLCPAGSPTIAALVAALAGTVAGLGVTAVLCSVMVYRATRRRLWSGPRTAVRFFATTLLLGMASALASAAASSRPGLSAFAPGARSLATALATLGMAKLLWELGILLHLADRQRTDLKRTALLLTGRLRPIFAYRIALGVAFGVIGPLLSAQAWSAAEVDRASVVVSGVVVLCGLTLAEMLERSLFFRAVSAPRMPGNWGS